MKKFIKNIIGYLLITLFLGNVISFLSNSYLKKGSFYKPSFLINNFSEGTKFDYFIIGSSRGLTTLNSLQIDKEIGTNGLNLSMDDTGLNTHFLMIQHFLNSGFKSDYCILTLDPNHFNLTKKEIGNNDYRFVPFTNKKYVDEYYDKFDKSNLGLLKNSNLNPFFTFSYYNLELFFPSILSFFKPKYRNKFDLKGNYSYPTINNKKTKKRNLKEITYEITNPLIKKISKLLEKQNTQLIIYIAPYQDRKINIASNFNFKTINHSSSIIQPNLFFDKIHVNKVGRRKATDIFIKSYKTIIKN